MIDVPEEVFVTEKNNLFTNAQVQSSRIIYTPSSFARSNLLYLQETGSLKALAPHESGRNCLSSYLFFVVVNGSGELNYGGKIYRLSEGNCVFIDCRIPYRHISDGGNGLWTLVWCHFDGVTMGGIYDKYVERGGMPVFKPDNVSAFVHLLDKIYKVAGMNSYTRDMQLFAEISNLCSLLMEQSWHPEFKSDEQTPRKDMLEVRNYIDENLDKKLTLESVADKFYINKSYLARCFKKQCGVTVVGYIQQARISSAKRKLRFTDDSIDEIAWKCGIPDSNYFSRMFKKIEGQSPGEYRRSWR